MYQNCNTNEYFINPIAIDPLERNYRVNISKMKTYFIISIRFDYSEPDYANSNFDFQIIPCKRASDRRSF